MTQYYSNCIFYRDIHSLLSKKIIFGRLITNAFSVFYNYFVAKINKRSSIIIFKMSNINSYL